MCLRYSGKEIQGDRQRQKLQLLCSHEASLPWYETGGIGVGKTLHTIVTVNEMSFSLIPDEVAVDAVFIP